jgi:hypothetical protein
MSALGVGFLVQDRYLAPALVALVGLTVAASALTFRRHGNPVPLAVTVLAGVSLYWDIYVHYNVTLVWVAAVALIAAQLWDVLAVRACSRRPL